MKGSRANSHVPVRTGSVWWESNINRTERVLSADSDTDDEDVNNADLYRTRESLLGVTCLGAEVDEFLRLAMPRRSSARSSSFSLKPDVEILVAVMKEYRRQLHIDDEDESPLRAAAFQMIDDEAGQWLVQRVVDEAVLNLNSCRLPVWNDSNRNGSMGSPLTEDLIKVFCFNFKRDFTAICINI